MFFFSYSRNKFLNVLGKEAAVEAFADYRSRNQTCKYRRTERAEMSQLCSNKHATTRYGELAYIQENINVVSWSRLDNREELLQKLSVSADAAKKDGDSYLLAAAWLKWGSECVHHLVGDFSFVIYDRSNEKVFCARDHLGVRPFYYYVSDGRFICANSIAILKNSLAVKLSVRKQWLVDHLCDLSMSFEETPYDQILKLPPGHCITLSPDHVQLTQYYTLSVPEPLLLKDSREYIESFREMLETSISCRLTADAGVGCEVSGGLDSSGIIGVAANLSKDGASSLNTFSFIAFEKEPEYLEELHGVIGNPPNHKFGWEELNRHHHKALDRAIEVLGHPIEHESATFHTPFYELAEKLGVGVLLSGFGGDEFVTNIHKDVILRGLLADKSYFRLFQSVAGGFFKRLAKTTVLVGKEATKKMFNRPERVSSFYKNYMTYYESYIVENSVKEQFSVKERYRESAKLDMGYTELHKFSVERRWQPFVPTRLESCLLMAAKYGVEYRWPLLDIRLVELFLSIPACENLNRGLGRNVYRSAVKPYIPDVIFNNPGKNMGEVLVQFHDEWLQENYVESDEFCSELQQIIDVDKYEKQLKIIREDCGNSETLLLYEKNIRRVRNLDVWLKRHNR